MSLLSYIMRRLFLSEQERISLDVASLHEKSFTLKQPTLQELNVLLRKVNPLHDRIDRLEKRDGHDSLMLAMDRLMMIKSCHALIRRLSVVLTEIEKKVIAEKELRNA